MLKKIAKEDLYKNLDNVNQWINSCDSKTSIILGLIGILLTIIFTNSSLINNLLIIIENNLKNINFCDILYLFFLAGALFTFFYGLGLLISVLIPIIKPGKKNIKSYTFFGSVSQYETFKEYKEDLLSATEEERNNDLLNQIYQNSIICNKKHCNYTKGVKYLGLGFINVIIMYIIGIIVYL